MIKSATLYVSKMLQIFAFKLAGDKGWMTLTHVVPDDGPIVMRIKYNRF